MYSKKKDFLWEKREKGERKREKEKKEESKRYYGF